MYESPARVLQNNNFVNGNDKQSADRGLWFFKQALGQAVRKKQEFLRSPAAQKMTKDYLRDESAKDFSYMHQNASNLIELYTHLGRFRRSSAEDHKINDRIHKEDSASDAEEYTGGKLLP